MKNLFYLIIVEYSLLGELCYWKTNGFQCSS